MPYLWMSVVWRGHQGMINCGKSMTSQFFPGKFGNSLYVKYIEFYLDDLNISEYFKELFKLEFHLRYINFDVSCNCYTKRTIRLAHIIPNLIFILCWFEWNGISTLTGDQHRFIELANNCKFADHVQIYITFVRDHLLHMIYECFMCTFTHHPHYKIVR